MNKNIDVERPFNNKVNFSDCTMIFPYKVIQAVEFNNKVIVNVSTHENKPQPWDTRNIWCYAKPKGGSTTGELLWKVEPTVNHRGEPGELPYYSVRWSEIRNKLIAFSDCFRYVIDVETGKVQFDEGGIK